MLTKKDIIYKSGSFSAVIPKNTMAIKCTNLPEDSTIKYWAMPWEGMSEDEESWELNYGFGLTEEEVTSE